MAKHRDANRCLYRSLIFYENEVTSTIMDVIDDERISLLVASIEAWPTMMYGWISKKSSVGISFGDPPGG
jgi:hypothetical protein